MRTYCAPIGKILSIIFLAALPGQVWSQSSFNIYGALDFGLSGGSEKSTLLGASRKITGIAISSGAERPSRLGFRGSETWGDISSFFTIEFGLSPNSETIIPNSPKTFTQAFLGLRKNEVGDMAIGTQLTLIQSAAIPTDPGQLNGIPGNVIFPLSALIPGSGGTGSQQIYFSGSDTNASWTVRQNNMLSVNTARIEGFAGHASYVLDSISQNESPNNNATAQDIQHKTSGWGLGVDYIRDQFAVTIAHQSFKNNSPYLLSSASSQIFLTGKPAIFGAAGSPMAGVNISDNQTYIATTYRVQNATFYLQWTQRKASNVQNTDYYVKRSAQQIGMRSFLTPNIEAWASIGNGSFYVYGVNSPKTSLSGWQVGSYYWLSKRVNFYAIYGAQTTGTYVAPMGRANNYQANVYALGIRYAF